MSEFNLQRARELCAKATAGPWRYYDCYVPFSAYEISNELGFGVGRIAKSRPASKDDAAFIAEARTLLPQACEEIERLRRVEAASKRYADALVRIHNEFEQINGNECERHCGKCAKCIAHDALMPFPHGEEPDCGILAISPELLAALQKGRK